jgi:putative exporter of polyketide antibiotics
MAEGPSVAGPSRIRSTFPEAKIHVAPIAWLLLIDPVLTGVDSLAFRRRDLRQA